MSKAESIIFMWVNPPVEKPVWDPYLFNDTVELPAGSATATHGFIEAETETELDSIRGELADICALSESLEMETTGIEGFAVEGADGMDLAGDSSGVEGIDSAGEAGGEGEGSESGGGIDE